MYFEVGIGPVLTRIVETYVAIVHQGFDYLFYWADWVMPAWLKDVVTLYVVLGAASLRGQMFGLLVGGTFFEAFIFHFVLWWRSAYRTTLQFFRELGPSYKALWRQTWPDMIESGAVAPDASLDEFVANRRSQTRWEMYMFWLNFLSVPLAAACFILIESGL